MTELKKQHAALNAEYRRALATRAPNHRELAQELQALEHQIRCERAGALPTPPPTVNPATDHPDRRSRESSRGVPVERTRTLTMDEVRDIRQAYERVKGTTSEREFATRVIDAYGVSREAALNILRGVTYRDTSRYGRKLTDEQTSDIIRRYDAAKAAGSARGLCAQMAREYGISKARMSEIVNGHGKQEKQARSEG